MICYFPKIHFFSSIIVLFGISHSLDAMHWVNHFIKPKRIITRVKPNSAKSIRLPYNAQQEHVIRTDGLIGCHATILYVKEPFNEHVLLTHYAPRSDRYAEHARDLEKSIQCMPLEADPKKIVFIVAVAGSYEDDNGNGNIRYHDEKCKVKAIGLTESAFKTLKDRSHSYGLMMEPKIIPYGQLPPTGKAYLDASVYAELSKDKPSLWGFSEIMGDSKKFEF